MLRPRVDLSKTEDGMMADFAAANDISKERAYAVAGRLLLNLSDEIEFDPADDELVDEILAEIDVSDDLDI